MTQTIEREAEVDVNHTASALARSRDKQGALWNWWLPDPARRLLLLPAEGR
jgi:hypothetical protein